MKRLWNKILAWIKRRRTTIWTISVEVTKSKKLELVKHTPHEEGEQPYYTIELDGKNAFGGMPLRSITTLEQAQLNYDAVKKFKKPIREVIQTDEVNHE